MAKFTLYCPHSDRLGGVALFCPLHPTFVISHSLFVFPTLVCAPHPCLCSPTLICTLPSFLLLYTHPTIPHCCCCNCSFGALSLTAAIATLYIHPTAAAAVVALWLLLSLPLPVICTCPHSSIQGHSCSGLFSTCLHPNSMPAKH